MSGPIDRPGRIAHRPELDGLRGLAVLVVLAAHVPMLGVAREGGLAGVTLFFVLSGYLITRLLVAEWTTTARVDLRSFYLRRALRLFPALAAVLVVVVTGYGLGLWQSNPADLAAAVPAVIFYVGNWVAAMGVPFGVLGHTWSLGVEEQFYLVWPILLILVLSRVSLRTLGTVAVIVAVLITPWRLVLLLNGHLGWAFNGTDAHADGLLLGCAIALLGPRLPSGLGWLGVVGVIATSIVWIGGGGLVVMVPLATIASALAVACAPTALGWKPLAFVGRISYGLYLWHFLFIWSGLAAPVVVLLSFAAAIVSFYVIERPFLRVKDRLRSVGFAATFGN
jgi:peptidoglycan/LPS O-acetylase OafA/YrhL